MSSYVMKLLATQKIEVKELLAAAKSKISVSVDIWTSSNYLSFLRVVAHFVSKLAFCLNQELSVGSYWPTFCNTKLTSHDRCRT